MPMTDRSERDCALPLSVRDERAVVADSEPKIFFHADRVKVKIRLHLVAETTELVRRKSDERLQARRFEVLATCCIPRAIHSEA